MSVYLIKEGNELHIIPVLPEQEVAFQQKYERQILMSGDNVLDVLREFDEMSVIFHNGV